MLGPCEISNAVLRGINFAFLLIMLRFFLLERLGRLTFIKTMAQTSVIGVQHNLFDQLRSSQICYWYLPLFFTLSLLTLVS